VNSRTASWLSGLWVVLIYVSLPLNRSATELLRGADFLSVVILLLALAGAALCLVALRRDGRRAPVVPAVPLFLSAIGFVLLASHWPLVEERIHVIQYGVLGVLLSTAIPRKLVVACLLGVAAGCVDECIQGYLPDRTFDAWDIAANVISVIAAVLLGQGGRLSWGAPALLLAASLLLAFVHSPAGSESPMTVLSPTKVSSGEAALDRPQETTPRAPVGESAPPVAPFPAAPVLLVTIDALRADAVPPWAKGEVALPGFERLAREAVFAQEGFANSIWTTPGIQSLLTGLLPEVHGVQARGTELPTRPMFPLEQLRQQGYECLGYAGDETETYHHLGFEREMDKDQDTVQQSVDALSQQETHFVWLHMRQVHAPYDASSEHLAKLGLPASLPSSPILDRARTHPLIPRRDFPGRHDWLREAIRSLYVSEVVDVDREMTRLFELLDEAGLLSKVLMVVTADHGEELLEYGGIGHASTTLNSVPRPELVQIPFYFRLPGAARGGSHLGGRFEQVDFMPSLFGLLGLRLELPTPGVSFDGKDRSEEILGTARELGPLWGPSIVSSTPCGWQCTPERRSERVHARVEGTDWKGCRPPLSECSVELRSALAEQAVRANLLRAE
jgi:hypothetical protein